MATAAREERSIGQLLRELTNEIATLVRKEIALARAEVSDKASRLGGYVGELAVGGAIAFAGGLVLLTAVVLLVAELLQRWVLPAVAYWLAALIVGAVVAATGFGMLRGAMRKLKGESLSPQRTTQTLQENKAWLQSKIQ